MPFYVPLGPRGLLIRVGSLIHNWMGVWIYWRASRRRGLNLPATLAIRGHCPDA